MPTYEYGCKACGKTWEREQRITEDPIKDCPHCNAPEARRLISGATFMLKGGGWYADGYGSKKPADTKPSSDSKPSTDSKAGTDSKSAKTDSAATPASS